MFLMHCVYQNRHMRNITAFESPYLFAIHAFCVGLRRFCGDPCTLRQYSGEQKSIFVVFYEYTMVYAEEPLFCS